MFSTKREVQLENDRLKVNKKIGEIFESYAGSFFSDRVEF